MGSGHTSSCNVNVATTVVAREPPKPKPPTPEKAVADFNEAMKDFNITQDDLADKGNLCTKLMQSSLYAKVEGKTGEALQFQKSTQIMMAGDFSASDESFLNQVNHIIQSVILTNKAVKADEDTTSVLNTVGKAVLDKVDASDVGKTHTISLATALVKTKTIHLKGYEVGSIKSVAQTLAQAFGPMGWIAANMHAVTISSELLTAIANTSRDASCTASTSEFMTCFAVKEPNHPTHALRVAMYNCYTDGSTDPGWRFVWNQKEANFKLVVQHYNFMVAPRISPEHKAAQQKWKMDSEAYNDACKVMTKTWEDQDAEWEKQREVIKKRCQRQIEEADEENKPAKKRRMSEQLDAHDTRQPVLQLPPPPVFKQEWVGGV